MSGRDDHGGDLVAELEALLAAAAAFTVPPPAEPLDVEQRTIRAAAETDLQHFANALAALCQRVIDEADEATARAFWRFLINTAAKHGRRAGGWPS